MARKKLKRRKEEIAEDWCFVCKDGGLLRVCDYGDCLKAYHPRCVGYDDTFLEDDSYWTCGSHFCDRCRKTSQFRCLCCPSAVCGKCIYFGEFAIIKGKKGVCRHCSKLAFLIEGNADVDSDGGNIDFKDRETYECLFAEYYEIIKKEEGLNSQHVHSARNFLKNSKNKSELDLDEIAEEEDDSGESEDGSDFEVSDCDDLNVRDGVKSAREKKHTEKLKSIKGDKKKEFIGWGSRNLIDFLKYTGRDTSRELSECDVALIITEYCKENKLFDPQKKRNIICDQQLRSLLGRRSVNRNNIQNLLAPHFAENFKEMDDVTSSSEDRDDNEPFVISTRRKLISSTKPCQNIVSKKTQSFFAAIISSNLKLVYLKRSLLEELLKQPDTFDSKVFGSFVRIKSDPNDYLQKNSHLLLPVVGINRSSKNDENNKEILLKLSHVPKGVPICKISDDDFTEEECQDLYQRMRSGLLKQPTILELEQKARCLHEDIIKHWIPRELALLQNRIDQANEKGRRRELSEYLDRKLKLETPLEQSLLLSNIPKVIPEIVDTNPSPEGSPSKDKLEQNGLPELAIGETCDSDGCYSKHNGFARCLNKRTDVADLPVENDMDPSDLMTQILAIQEQQKHKVSQDAEQAKDQENDPTTLVADGIGKQHGAPDFGVADNSKARIGFTSDHNILVGSSTVPDPTVIDDRKRKNPSKTEPVKKKKTKAEIEEEKKEMQAHEKIRLWDPEFLKTPIDFKDVDDGQLDSLSIQEIIDLTVKQSLRTASVARSLGSVVIPYYEETIMKHTQAAEMSKNGIIRLSTKLTDAEQERDKLAEKVKTLISKMGTLEEDVLSLKTKCSYAEASATSAAASFEEKKKEVENLQKKIKMDEDKINSLMTEKENFFKLLEDEQKKNKSAEKSLESKKKEVENLTSLLLRAAKGAFDNAVNQLTILNPGLKIEGAASDRVAREGKICNVKEGKCIPCPDVHPPE
ncbi:zinc finger CCCH domain-containing protein 19-like isoform X2 [Lotus japonicus]|uniref:zinc finger CCCH domain-containing protein 19-like isoform X2 n=1 Tax=Lotus japonicus TaxID=34305 RepID=UPI00258D121E|nr:zinc finger CCCH domain-containing protein 19-like isoform X2 [Lotus japonicus]